MHNLAIKVPDTDQAGMSCSEKTLALLIGLLEARSGQRIATHRAWRIDTALRPVLQTHNMHNLDELARDMMRRPGLTDDVVDALLNNETSFFRDPAVFDSLMPLVDAVENQGRRARIWCAGCSTGQESLSLAMMFAERSVNIGTRSPELIATDLSQTALRQARCGRYSQFEIQRGLSVHRMLKWFDERDGEWEAKPELVRTIAFRHQNLVSTPPPAGGFDLILCRNVLLYLSPELKAQVFDRIASALRPGGLLLLGAGETVIGHTRLLRPSRQMPGFYERE